MKKKAKFKTVVTRYCMDERGLRRRLAKATKAERDRCVAWVEQLIKDNEDIIRKLGHSQRRMENEHSIEDLALVRSHIKSGEKLP